MVDKVAEVNARNEHTAPPHSSLRWPIWRRLARSAEIAGSFRDGEVRRVLLMSVVYAADLFALLCFFIVCVCLCVKLG
jgi:hypothetical protein